MDQKNFSIILDLLRKTGGKYVIFEEKKVPIVLMELNEYQKLLNHQKEDPDSQDNNTLDKANRDIAIWSEEQKNKLQNNPSLSSKSKEEKTKNPDPDYYQIKDV